MIESVIRAMAATAVVFAACGTGPGATRDWAGAVYDSAGIVVIANPEIGHWTSATAWRLEEDLRIGAAGGDPAQEFGRVEDIAVDAVGRIHVLDRQAREVRIFDADGTFLRPVGRPGSGPGELSSPSAVLIGAGDTILVPDMANARVQRFLADGSDAGAFATPLADGIPLAWHTRPDGLLLQEVRTLPEPQPGADGERTLVLIRASNGQIRDTLLDMPAGESMELRGGQPEMTMFAPEPMWACLTDGRIAVGWNADYRLEVRNPDGGVERVIHKPFERRRFGESDRRALRTFLLEQHQDGPPSPGTDRMLQSLSYADHYPVYAALFGGPSGTLWVRDALDVSQAELAQFDVRAFGGWGYDVFDRDGRFLGTITTPERFRPLHTRGDHVYGVQPDELGVQYVVRLRLARPDLPETDG